MMKRCRALLLLFLLAGCAQEPQSEDYGIRSAADLYLTADNHPHGFGKSECFLCHIPSHLHQVNRINSPSFDLANELIRQSGTASCSGCHGPNRVTP